MKYSIALLACMVCGLNLHAQLTQAGDRSLALNVNGIINNTSVNPAQDAFGNSILLSRYFINQNTALRAGLGFQGNNKRVAEVDSLGPFRRQFDSSATRFDMHLHAGVERYLEVSPKMLVYFGGHLALSLLGKETNKSNTRLTDTTGTRVIEINELTPGGFRIGAILNTGFQYFLAPRLALGAEYFIGLQSSRFGGDYNRTIIDNPITGAPSVNRISGSTLQRDRGLLMANQAQIHLTYYFRLSPKTRT